MRNTLVVCIAGILTCALLFPAVALAQFGIEPGKVFIDNLYPGAEADVPITVYNQNDYTATFLVSARQPDYTETGYEPFPHLDWISIEPEQVTIDAHENSEVMVVIIMPEDAVYSGKKAETWISFMEQGIEGMINIEIASRLLISTRVEVPVLTPEEAPVLTPEEAPVLTPEEAPALTPEEAPAVQGNGAVGITAEPGGAETVSPEVESGFPWAIMGSALGVVLVGGAVFFLVRRKRQHV